MLKHKLIVVVGPTASGKTALAAKLAKRFNGEIINADSRQIYKGVNIGTAKPKGSWSRVKGQGSRVYLYKGIRHYLIDFLEPYQRFNVAQYKRLALQAIKAIHSRKKLPILTGGTGLYIKTVVDNLNIPRVPPQPALRRKLEKQMQKTGLKLLYRKLIKLDPEAAYIVDPDNPRRVIRALEITLTTKKPFSQQRNKGKKLFEILQLGIRISPTKLKQRINLRTEQMIKKGLLKEVRMLVKKYGPDQTAFDAIGYREIISYLYRQLTLKEATELIKRNTRDYARRQLTWFKKDKRIHWIKAPKQAEKLISNFLKK